MGKMWGGRFDKKTQSIVEDFSRSIHFDKRLVRYDILGSMAQIQILKKAGILNQNEYRRLQRSLKEILGCVEKGRFEFDYSFEDIHSYIQHLVEKKAGKVALKMHTSRSRNDQVVFDLKCYCLENLKATRELLKMVIDKLDKLARSNRDIILPGYTHLQHAMPVRLSTYLECYIMMLKRDYKRFVNAEGNIKLTMGAGAMAGTIIEHSCYRVSSGGFKVSPPENPIDSVSDRDFVIEILGDIAITGMHLSRLAEDFIIWFTKEFDFIDIDEAFCTGSSLMPQKKNPDVFELIRGYAGILYGNLVGVLSMMKGLPLSYNRDMQLDKEPLFNSFDIIHNELRVLIGLLPGITFKRANIKRQLEDELLYATDMVDYLVKNKVPFKEAHTIIGRLIRYKLDSGKDIRDMSYKELKGFHPLLKPEILKHIMDPEVSVKTRVSFLRSY